MRQRRCRSACCLFKTFEPSDRRIKDFVLSEWPQKFEPCSGNICQLWRFGYQWYFKNLIVFPASVKLLEIREKNKNKFERNAWGYGILSTFTLLKTYTRVIYWSKEYFLQKKFQDTQRMFLCLSTDLYIQPFCWNLHITYKLYWIEIVQ